MHTAIGIPKRVIAKGNYGLLLQREGRLAEAEPLLRRRLGHEAIALADRTITWSATARVSLAMLLHDKGDLPGAESEFRQALAIYDKSLPDESSVPSVTAHAFRAAPGRSRINPTKRLPRARTRSRSGPRPRRPSSPQTAQAHAIHAYALEHARQIAAGRRGTRRRSAGAAQSARS